MKKSPYFAELSSAYSAEIDDLTADSEGKSVLAARLKEKRMALETLLQMIEFAPEMVLPVFHAGFSFTNHQVLAHLVQCEPDDDDFPSWETLALDVVLADWARPLAERVLAVSGGEQFMVVSAAAEFLRLHDHAAATPVPEEKNDFAEDDEDGEGHDLGEAGADWLSEQGFDSHNG